LYTTLLFRVIFRDITILHIFFSPHFLPFRRIFIFPFPLFRSCPFFLVFLSPLSFLSAEFSPFLFLYLISVLAAFFWTLLVLSSCHTLSSSNSLLFPLLSYSYRISVYFNFTCLTNCRLSLLKASFASTLYLSLFILSQDSNRTFVQHINANNMPKKDCLRVCADYSKHFQSLVVKSF
jgi:hypothetical protein